MGNCCIRREVIPPKLEIKWWQFFSPIEIYKSMTGDENGIYGQIANSDESGTMKFIWRASNLFTIVWWNIIAVEHSQVTCMASMAYPTIGKSSWCFDCHGSGFVTCPVCHGHKHKWGEDLMCWKCGNIGSIGCKNCHGTGKKS